jgi:aarF domain-containing kinase
LTPGNAKKLAQRLSHMRGAVMKLGQLMSMDGQGVLPPQFAALLASLRERAHHMPTAQLQQVLKREYGAQWQDRFRHFDTTPIAAASIGQVHCAQTHDGKLLALKIQYPGVRQSIHSDIANIALLGRLPGLVPAGMDGATLFKPVLDELRTQLLHETDYRAEARAATRYKLALGADPVLHVPAIDPAHCTAHILASEFVAGVPVDQLAGAQYSQALRDSVALALCRLAVREFFEMRCVQTDPNFGNYLYDARSGRIALLDFGATQNVALRRVAQLRALARALRDNDAERTRAAATAAGFIQSSDSAGQADGVAALLLTAGEPLRHNGPYDFGQSDLFGRAFDQGRVQFFGEGFARPPPPDLLFLQRKFVGTFMLCVRLRARVDLQALFKNYL